MKYTLELEGVRLYRFDSNSRVGFTWGEKNLFNAPAQAVEFDSEEECRSFIAASEQFCRGASIMSIDDYENDIGP